MKILENMDLCNGCHACYSVCPQSCIVMEEDSEGFLFPKIDGKECNKCGLCKKTCPMNKTQAERTGAEKIPRAFAVTHKNEEILLASSSGGAFTLLAEYVINQGGVVFAVRFNENWETVHDYTETVEGLAAFRRSKNIQSRMGGTYKQVKSFLSSDGDRKVLFCGTPCQIGGLKSYLQKDYENLLCVDLICRGVSSPKVWQKYLRLIEKTAVSKIQTIAHRVKDGGLWVGSFWYVLITFADGTKYYRRKDKDLFKQADKSGLSSRKSCFDCGFKGENRIADITLADFWGVQKIAPEAYNSKGTSLVLVHSLKGQGIFDKAKHGAVITEIDDERTQKALQVNSMSLHSRPKNKKRTVFMKNIDHIPIDRLVNKYAKKPLAEQIRSHVFMNIKKVLGESNVEKFKYYIKRFF